jgi:hypothetical protein
MYAHIMQGNIRSTPLRSMNFITRTLRRGRMKMFPAIIEERISKLSSAECADALTAAASYCYSVGNKGEIGHQISRALINPRALNTEDAEALFFQLEDLYIAAVQSEVGASEERATSGRFGSATAMEYKIMVDRMNRAQATGYGVLMTGVLAQLGRFPDATLIKLRARLQASTSAVDDALTRVAAMANGLPGAEPWTSGMTEYHRQVAKTIASAI